MRQSQSRSQLRPLDDAGSIPRATGSQTAAIATPTDERALLLTVEEVSQLVGISVRQIQRLKRWERFPKVVRIGSSVRWRRRDVEQWVAEGCPLLENGR